MKEMQVRPVNLFSITMIKYYNFKPNIVSGIKPLKKNLIHIEMNS